MNEPTMNSWQDHNRNVPPAKAPNTSKEQEGTVPGRGTWAGWGGGSGAGRSGTKDHTQTSWDAGGCTYEPLPIPGSVTRGYVPFRPFRDPVVSTFCSTPIESSLLGCGHWWEELCPHCCVRKPQLRGARGHHLPHRPQKNLTHLITVLHVPPPSITLTCRNWPIRTRLHSLSKSNICLNN